MVQRWLAVLLADAVSNEGWRLAPHVTSPLRFHHVVEISASFCVVMCLKE